MLKNEVKHQVVIAVDPGAAGGIAIYSNGRLSTMPLARGDHDVRAFILAAQQTEHTYAFMEQVGGYIGKEQPGSHMFNFGNGYGFMRGLFCAFDIPCELVPPQKWQRAVCPGVAGLDYNVRKRAIKALSASWYPDLDVTLALADALAILRYALTKDAKAPTVASTGRSRAAWPADVKGFKKWCKKQKGYPVPKGAELITAVNWWTEQGRPEQ